MRSGTCAAWAFLAVMGLVVAGCIADVEDFAGEAMNEDIASILASNKCEPACNHGWSRYYFYCQNRALVPYRIKKKCEDFADEAHKVCMKQPQDFQCISPCEGLVGTFEQFCRENSTAKKCWENSIETFGACKKAAPR